MTPPARGSRPRFDDLDLELANRRGTPRERPSPRVWERLLRSVERELELDVN
ncbi:MAG: hypothetical protein KF773_32595 [Deltaproteobacteria bacterium]|nr:hypothetical protein [Deltaproteobacteria bacterium]